MIYGALGALSRCLRGRAAPSVGCQESALDGAPGRSGHRTHPALLSSCKGALPEAAAVFSVTNLPGFVCQVVHQLCDAASTHHMSFQHLEVFCFCQKPKLLLIYDVIQDQTSNLQKNDV